MKSHYFLIKSALSVIVISIFQLMFINVAYSNVVNLHRISLYDGKIKIEIPISFKPYNDLLNDEDKAKLKTIISKSKLPADIQGIHYSERFKLNLTFKDANENRIIILYGNKKLNEDELEQNMENFARKVYPYLYPLPLDEKKIIFINSRKFVMMKFRLPTNKPNEQLHVADFYTSYNKTKLAFSIILNDANTPNWDEIMQKIINSVEINGS